MMTAETLVVTFASRGIELAADGDTLMAKPASKLTDADREAIRQHKAALLDLLCAAPQRAPCAVPEDAAPQAPAIAPEPAPNAQAEPEPQAIAPPGLPLDLIMVIDAIRAAPRSPIETDLVCGRMARVAVELAHLLAELPPLAHAKALVLCRDASQLTAQAIYARNYLQAYALVDSLPGRIRQLRPQ